MTNLRLARGQHFGTFARRRTAGLFALAELVPTVPEPEVLVHTHDDAHVVLVLEGRYLSGARGAGAIPRLIVNPPGTTHRDRFAGGGRFVSIALAARAWSHLAGDEKLPRDAICLSGKALVAAYRAWQELEAWDGCSALAVETECHALLAAAATDGRLREDAAPARLARAVQRLLDDALTVPGVAELALIAGIHPVHFARLFRRHYGRSPATVLRRRRLELAVAMLLDRREPLAAVAADCGFVDQSHLHRSFVRAFGLTPRAFRGLGSRRGAVARIQDRGSTAA